MGQRAEVHTSCDSSTSSRPKTSSLAEGLLGQCMLGALVHQNITLGLF